MVKLMIAFAIASMIFEAFAEDCQNNHLGACSNANKCCDPYVCWIDGKCDQMHENVISLEGLEYETGKVGQFERYDTCPYTRSRIGEECTTDRDCCMPLDCKNNKCTAVEDLEKVLSVLRGEVEVPTLS